MLRGAWHGNTQELSSTAGVCRGVRHPPDGKSKRSYGRDFRRAFTTNTASNTARDKMTRKKRISSIRSDLQCRDRAIQLMNELELQNQEDLVRFCQDRKQEFGTRARACVALATLLKRAALPVLIELAADDDSGVVWPAANAIALIRSRAVTPSLLRIIRSSTVEAHRQAAISAIGSIGDSRAEKLLIDVLLNQSEPGDTRQFAAEALKGVHDRRRSIQPLLKALSDPSASVRWSVLTTLGHIGDQRAAESIRVCLSDEAKVPGLDSHEATVAFAAATALHNLECRRGLCGSEHNG